MQAKFRGSGLQLVLITRAVSMTYSTASLGSRFINQQQTTPARVPKLMSTKSGLALVSVQKPHIFAMNGNPPEHGVWRMIKATHPSIREDIVQPSFNHNNGLK